MKTLLKVLLIGLIILLARNTNAEDQLVCGKKFKIKTHDGSVIKGRLWMNDGETLVIKQNGMHSIRHIEIDEIYRGKEHKTVFAILGFGVGCFLGSYFCDRYDMDYGGCYLTGLSTSLVCCILGARVGRRILSYEKLHLDEATFCTKSNYNRSGPFGIMISFGIG